KTFPPVSDSKIKSGHASRISTTNGTRFTQAMTLPATRLGSAGTVATTISASESTERGTDITAWTTALANLPPLLSGRNPTSGVRRIRRCGSPSCVRSTHRESAGGVKTSTFHPTAASPAKNFFHRRCGAVDSGVYEWVTSSKRRFTTELHLPG